MMSVVNKIDGSQEKTVVDFISINEKDQHTIETTETFEPSVADEIEYNPSID